MRIIADMPTQRASTWSGIDGPGLWYRRPTPLRLFPSSIIEVSEHASLPSLFARDCLHPPLDHTLYRTSRALWHLSAGFPCRLVHLLAALVQRVNVVGAFLLVVVRPGQTGLNGAGCMSAPERDGMTARMPPESRYHPH